LKKNPHRVVIILDYRPCKKCGAFNNRGFTRIEEHHIIPKGLGGTDEDGRILLCERCHNIIGKLINAVIYPFLVERGLHKELHHPIKEFTERWLKIG